MVSILAYDKPKHMKILWIHNNHDRSSGTFMWDIKDRLDKFDNARLREIVVPLVFGLSAVVRAGRLVRQAPSVDIVHGQYGSFVGLLTCGVRAGRRIITLRGSDVYWRYGIGKTRLGALVRVALTRLALTRTDAVVVMSEAMRQRLKSWRLSPSVAIHLIHDPAGADFWPIELRSIADKLYRQPFRVVTGSVHRNNPVKRVETLEAAALLCQGVGMALELKILSGLTRSEVATHLRDADSVALCSTHEGWPNIIKEALLMGKAFVSTDVSDLDALVLGDRNHHIVSAHPLDFACAFVDQLASRIIGEYGFSPELAAFHPDVAALKHRLLYFHYEGTRA